MIVSTPIQANAATAKDQWVHQLGICESGGRANIKIVDSNGYYSYGYLQFQLATWLSYGKKFGSTKANIYSVALQTKVTESMLDKGLWRNWKNCYIKTTAKYGPYTS